jgi:cytochrome c peroxidase
LEPRPRPDVRIVFVDAFSRPEEWEKLESDWNEMRVADPVALATAPLDQSPLTALAGLHAASQTPVVKIKVPYGLPDPTPYIPSHNPPTVKKWALGKRLFFDRQLLPHSKSCAECHNPRTGFTYRDELGTPKHAIYNPPTLINVVYNKHLFWDGRISALEQVVHRTLDDERGPWAYKDHERPEKFHAWGGVVARLREDKSYRKQFDEVFGTDPNQDNLGRALATYLRTILAGDSIYDQAERRRQKTGAKSLQADHFEYVLNNPQAREALGEGIDPIETAKELALGHELFFGKARCAACHPPPLFHDQGFHNIGLQEQIFPHRESMGRFAVLPLGAKDARYRGAFKTPTLRYLARTFPYMHTGRYQVDLQSKGDSIQKTLEKVIAHYNTDLHAAQASDVDLDPILRHALGHTGRLGLSESEVRALALFLRSLNGAATAEKVMVP